MSIAAVILAGGASSRMGRDKSELMINNHTLVEHAKHKLDQAGIKQIFVSGARYDIPDMEAGQGPLTAILSSLLFLQERQASLSHALFMPVDMPGIKVETLKHLAEHKEQRVVRYRENNLPFMTPVNDHILETLRTQIVVPDKKAHSITDWMKRLDVVQLDFEGRISEFTDVNTPDEWREFQRNL